MVPWGAGMRTKYVLVVVLGSCMSLGPQAASAAAGQEPPADDIVGFDAGFRDGQGQFNRGEYLSAARTWTGAIALLSESPDNKDNRAAVHGYVADAYRKAVLNGASDEIIREGLAVLDAYASGFMEHYPGEELPAQVAEARAVFRAAIEAAEAAEEPEPEPVIAPAPVVAPEPSGGADAVAGEKPWLGLTIGGGVALGGGLAMMGMFVGGLVRTRQATAEFDKPVNACSSANITGRCAEIDEYARSMDRVATIGVVAGPVLLAAGAVMLAIGLKRRSARRTIAPVFSPRMAGIVWTQQF